MHSVAKYLLNCSSYIIKRLANNFMPTDSKRLLSYSESIKMLGKPTKGGGSLSKRLVPGSQMLIKK